MCLHLVKQLICTKVLYLNGFTVTTNCTSAMAEGGARESFIPLNVISNCGKRVGYSHQLRAAHNYLTLTIHITYNFVSIHSTGVTQDLLKLVVNCSDNPETWCRAQFSGDCFCISHGTSNISNFPENTTFLTTSISLLLSLSEFRRSFAGSFIVCASGRSIHKAYHIAGIYIMQIYILYVWHRKVPTAVIRMQNYFPIYVNVASYTRVNTDDSDRSEARQAAINTIIVCLTSILICVGPCFVLTFISKWRQEQLRQKIIEGERENDNGAPSIKLYNDPSKINLFNQRPSADSQAVLLSLKNFKRSTSSSAGSIFSISGEFCFKQERIGRLHILIDLYFGIGCS